MPSLLGKMQSIIPEEPDSWSDSLFLTFDVDWAHDVILEDLINILEANMAQATFFLTHQTPILDRIIRNELFETGIHPNFNSFLFKENNTAKDFRSVIEGLMELTGGVKLARSHSLVFGSPIEAIYEECGITHESSLFIPHQHNQTPIHPFRMYNKMIKVPYFFCDMASCVYSPESLRTLILRPGLKVFDFHPIHVFLNTEHLDRYESTRHLHKKPEELIKYRYEGKGTRTRLLELLKLVGSSVVTTESNP